MYHVGFVNKVEMLNCNGVFLNFSFSKGSRKMSCISVCC